jgi:hypothetical protein
MKAPKSRRSLRSDFLRLRGGLAVWFACVAWTCPGIVVGRAASVVLPGAPDGSIVQPVAPSGLSNNEAATSLASGLGDDLLDGFGFGTTFSTIYNSNVSANQGQTSDSAKDDFILGLGGNLDYLSRASTLTFGANYRGTYNEYINHSDYSGYSQGGGVLANYDGGDFTVTANAGADIDRGSNSNYSSNFVQRTNIHSGLMARYRISPKTSLVGNFSQSNSSTSSGNYSDVNSYDFGTSAMWRYSQLTEFGPGIRYAYRTGSTQIGRTSIGPTLNTNYKLSRKVALTSRIGMDFSRYENGVSADPAFSASIGLNYQASKLWGLNFSYWRDTQADTSQVGGFTQLSSLQLGYHRKLRKAMLNLGLRYQTNSYEMPDNTTRAARPDQDYFSINSSLGMPVFSDTCNASVFVSYNDQGGGGTGNSYNSVQTGFSISRSF